MFCFKFENQSNSHPPFLIISTSAGLNFFPTSVSYSIPLVESDVFLWGFDND